MKVTLDTNGIVDLEENRASAPALRSLVELDARGSIRLRVVGISGSERQRGGGYAPTFAVFQDKLQRAGLGNAEILKPMGYWDVTYWDWCLWAGDEEMQRLEREIHGILFPTAPFEYPGERDAKWRNQKCDVLALWSHVYHDGDVFVTRDENFLSPGKRAALEALGARKICTPEEAVSLSQVSGNRCCSATGRE